MPEKEKIFLGIDTATSVFMLLLGKGNELLFSELIPGRYHSEKLIPSIEDMMRSAGLDHEDIDAIGAGIGPGSFTGIRIGLSCAFTLAQILKKPVYGISAMDLAGKTCNYPAVHAFRDRYYTAGFDASGTRTEDYKIVSAEELENLGGIEIELDPLLFLDEIVNNFNTGKKGDWRETEPIYIMETEYKEKTGSLT